MLEPHGIMTDTVDGMKKIPDTLGNEDVVGVKEIVEELDQMGFDGPTTLEIAGKEAVQESAKRLQEWSRG